MPVVLRQWTTGSLAVFGELFRLAQAVLKLGDPASVRRRVLWVRQERVKLPFSIFEYPRRRGDFPIKLLKPHFCRSHRRFRLLVGGFDLADMFLWVKGGNGCSGHGASFRYPHGRLVNVG